MFSVVIPLYNKELSIRNTLQSVLDQTFTDFEIVIVNDGSTDSSAAIVEEFTDPRIRLIHQENQGVSAARNRGIREAKNEWIAFLDGDDLWKEDHLETIRKMIDKYPKDKIFTTSYNRSHERLPDIQDHDIAIIENYFTESIKGHFTWTGVICIHQSVFEEVGGFNVRLNRGEDLEMWTQIGRKYRFIKSNHVTAIYRVEAENRSDLYFDLQKSRVYNYDFKNSTSKSETKYYKNQIITTLMSFIINKEFNNFLILKRKHSPIISNLDIIKSFTSLIRKKLT